MKGEALVSQLQFLTDMGLYSGPLNTPWGREQSDAMKGWACRHSSGNTTGEPMTGLIDPPGYKFVDGILVKLNKVRGRMKHSVVLDEAALQPAPKPAPAPAPNTPLTADQVEQVPPAKPKPAKQPKQHKSEAFKVSGGKKK